MCSSFDVCTRLGVAVAFYCSNSDADTLFPIKMFRKKMNLSNFLILCSFTVYFETKQMATLLQSLSDVTRMFVLAYADSEKQLKCSHSITINGHLISYIRMT